jgi:F-type H+-transporting ATPase subunit b
MRYVWPPIVAAMAERQQKIADGLAAADRAGHDLELAQKQATERMAEAKREAASIIEAANKRASAVVDEAKSAAVAEADRIKAAAAAAKSDFIPITRSEFKKDCEWLESLKNKPKSKS